MELNTTSIILILAVMAVGIFVGLVLLRFLSRRSPKKAQPGMLKVQSGMLSAQQIEAVKDIAWQVVSEWAANQPKANIPAGPVVNQTKADISVLPVKNVTLEDALDEIVDSHKAAETAPSNGNGHKQPGGPPSRSRKVIEAKQYVCVCGFETNRSSNFWMHLGAKGDSEGPDKHYRLKQAAKK